MFQLKLAHFGVDGTKQSDAIRKQVANFLSVPTFQNTLEYKMTATNRIRIV